MHKLIREFFVIAALIALASTVLAFEDTDDVSISTKAPHICDDCQSAIHTR